MRKRSNSKKIFFVWQPLAIIQMSCSKILYFSQIIIRFNFEFYVDISN